MIKPRPRLKPPHLRTKHKQVAVVSQLPREEAMAEHAAMMIEAIPELTDDELRSLRDKLEHQLETIQRVRAKVSKECYKREPD